AEQQKTLKPLRDEVAELNKQLNEIQPKLRALFRTVPGLEDVVNARSVTARELRKANDRKDTEAAQAAQAKIKGELTARLNEVTKDNPEAKKLVLDREAVLRKMGDNRAKQAGPAQEIRGVSDEMQTWQETGGLVGRILLAVLLVLIVNRRILLRVF